MDHHLRRSKDKTLPLVYPFIFYTGKKAYTYSLDIFDLFGIHKNRARELFQQPLRLLDITHTSESTLDQHNYFKHIALTVKYVRHHKELLSFAITTLMEHFRFFETTQETEYIRSYLRYILNWLHEKDHEAIAHHITALHQGEQIMGTIAESYIKKGRMAGRTEGENLKAKVIAKNLLDLHIPLDTIFQSTGLSLEEIKALKIRHSKD